MNINFKRLILGILVLSFLIPNTFAASCFSGSTVSNFFSESNLRCIFNNLQWLDWAIYFALLIGLTLFIKNLALKQLEINNRAKTTIAMIVSFIGVTGLVWTMVEGGFLPRLIVLTGGWLIVVGIGALLVLHSFAKEKKDDKESDYKYNNTYRILMIMLAALIINQYHFMLLKTLQSTGLTNTNYLYQIAYFLSIPIHPGIFLLVFCVLTLIFRYESKEEDKKDDDNDDKKKKSSPLMSVFLKSEKKGDSGSSGSSKKDSKEFDDEHKKEIKKNVDNLELVINEYGATLEAGKIKEGDSLKHWNKRLTDALKFFLFDKKKKDEDKIKHIKEIMNKVYDKPEDEVKAKRFYTNVKDLNNLLDREVKEDKLYEKKTKIDILKDLYHFIKDLKDK